MTCQDYEVITSAMTKFTVEVKSVNAFFDAKSYALNETLLYEQTYTQTNLLPLFGQIKQYFVGGTKSTLFNSLLYHPPWSHGIK